MKVCCVFNYNPLYRLPIYNAMADKFDCDFFFGDTVFQPLKAFDAHELKGFKGFIKARKTKFKSFIWHSSIKPIFSRKYTHYVLTGDSSMIINWLIILYAKIFRKKVYLWSHGVKTSELKTSTRLLFKAFFTHVTGVLMYNRYNCKYMKMIGCREECLHVIHNSLDTSTQSAIYERLSSSDIYTRHFGNNNPTLIYIGRIQRVKKTEQILDAMALLKEKGLYVNLVVVGANVDDEMFTQKLSDYQLQDNVWMYGPCFDEKKNSELIYNAAVCVSPGNVGLTCIHVLSYGTPVITNDNFSTQGPEYEAIKKGVTGDFFKENDIDDLANKIDYWISLTPEQRSNSRNIARETIVNEWSVDYQINLLTKILI